MITNKKIFDEIKLISDYANAELWWKAYLLNVNILNDDSLFEESFNALPELRKNKVRDFKFRKDKNLSIGAWAALTYAMLQNGFDDFENKIKINNNCKPYMSNKCKNHCYFNLSHSGQYALCAISNKEIGCDIQKHGKIDKNLIGYCMNNTELTSFKDTKYDDWCEQSFYRLWTLKESYVKMMSLGMQINPKNILFLKIDKQSADCQVKILDNVHKAYSKNLRILSKPIFCELNAPKNYNISLCVSK